MNGEKSGPFDPKPASDVFARTPVGGGVRKPRVASPGGNAGEENASSASDAESAEPLSPDSATGPDQKPKVRLHTPVWDRELGHFNGMATARVSADLPAEFAHLTRISFTVFALAQDGKRERIDGGEAHLKDGVAEKELSLFYPSFREEGGLPKACEYLFTAKHRDSEEIESPALKVETVPCIDRAHPAAEAILGTCPYYQWRNDNFVQRHPGCHRKPPPYYMEYGFKYCIRFSKDTAPKLSAHGKRWLALARLYLQHAIETGLKNTTTLEMESGSFKDYAFKSHPKAYWDAGLGNLPLKDLIIIGFTPDIKEWLDEGTRAQAYDVAGRMVEEYRYTIEEAIKQRSQDVVEYFKEFLH